MKEVKQRLEDCENIVCGYSVISKVNVIVLMIRGINFEEGRE